MRFFLRIMMGTLLLMGTFDAGALWAQVPVDTLARLPLLRDKTIVPLPVVFRLPETGFGAGAVVSGAFSFSRDSLWAKPSQLSLGMTYTQNRQILVFLPFSIFLKNNRYYLFSDTGWYRYNYFYYGIGEARVPQEYFDVTYPRVRLLAARQLGAKTYAGLRYQYESYRVTRTDAGGELASGRVAGSSYSRTSSLGPSFLRDTRDSVFYPHKGMFGEFYVLPTARLLGADRNFVRIYLDVANYLALSRRWVLATNYVVSTVRGREIPFSQLSFLGGPKKMRGIYEGFFRDKNALLGQAELRWELGWRLGLVGFGAVGFLGDETQVLRLAKPKYTYGAGLRLKVQKKNHLNVRADYGLSPYGGGQLYLTLGEAF